MLDANTIHKRDCIAGMAQLAPGSVDLAFADPPFNIGYDYDVYDDAKETEHYLDWSRQWIDGVFHALKPTGTFWLAIGDEYAAELKIIAQKIGFTCRSWVIWYYTFGVNCKQKFSRSHAHLFHFVKDEKRFTFNDKTIRVPSARQLVYADARANPIGRLPDDTWILRPQDAPNGFTAEEDTWYFPRVAGTFKERAGFHGCQMPEQLLGRIIRCCSDTGDLVLDPFAGSATTLVVAKKLGRQWIGFDLSADYVRHGRARVKVAKVDGPLVGAAEPLVSAPATPVENLNGASASGKYKKAKQIKSQVKPSKPPQVATARRTISPQDGGSSSRIKKEQPSDGIRPSRLPRKNPNPPVKFVPAGKRPAFENASANKAADFEAGIIEAFRLGGSGFSADRIVADDELNAAFAEQCRRLGLAGTVRDWNRALLRFRKAGKLAQLSTKRRTEFDWKAADRYLFASEIALGRMEEQGQALDDVLCDPELRSAFDDIARSFAPGFAPLEYRWGALRIRKVASESLAKSAGINEQKLPRARDLFEIPFAQLRNKPGLYLVSKEMTTDMGSALYAGVTLDLEKRLRLLLDGCKLRASWNAYAATDRLFVRTLELDAPGDDNWISELTPHQSRLVGSFAPLLNFKNLASA